MAELTGLLQDQVAIISGVGPGLGQATAHAFAREGANVVLAARSADYLDDLAGELGASALTVPTDITKPEQCAALVDAAVQQFGKIDTLVNAAMRLDPHLPFEEVDLARWRKVYDVNVFGTLQLTHAAIPHLKANETSSVVFVSSMSARKIRPNEGGYASSKAALLTATQVFAKEFGRDQIRINAVVPGWMWGAPVQQYVAWESEKRGVAPQAIIDEIVANIPLGEIPTQEAVADAIVFLASDMARWITGQSLDVNGGEHFE